MRGLASLFHLKFLIITHVVHTLYQGKFFAYSPYVREMNIWLKHADEIIIVAPIDPTAMPGPIDLAYMHNNISFIEVPSFDLLGIKSLMVPLTVLQIFSTCIRAMKDTDHIHLRCPGNMGLIGCIAQIFFPSKKKTAKYAGNWDWQSKQPWS